MTASSAPFRVYYAQGWGSVLAEAMLALAGFPFERIEVDPSKPSDAQKALTAANPLRQLPTVVMPDGTVMTESAAMALLLSEMAPDSGLAPPPGSPDRPRFLRWLTFLVAAVYPTFTYGDDPSRWVKTSPDELRESTNAHRKVLFSQLEAEVKGPYFLGEARSAIDVYLCAMTHWRPRRAYFAEHCPKIHAIAVEVDKDPKLAPIWAHNFSG